MRRNTPSVLSNPVLVGAVTVLAAMLAVFLAYTANAGLPFVPTKELRVDVANGANLVVGSDVREGGYRIGLVSGLAPIELASGRVGAQLTLRLNNANGSVPVDSTASIRPLSVLGSKYVDLHEGSSKLLIADGGTLPISQTTVPVQFEDVFQTFNPQDAARDPGEPCRHRRRAGGSWLRAERHDRKPARAARASRAGRSIPLFSEHRADPVPAVAGLRSRGRWRR